MDIRASSPEIPLNTYFAVQIAPRESRHLVVEAVCKISKEVGHLFRRIEALDTFQIGSTTFLRMRSDMTEDVAVMTKIREVTGRAVVVRVNGKYEAQFPPNLYGGKIHPVSMVEMHSIPRGTNTLYRGPKIKHWGLQFNS